MSRYGQRDHSRGLAAAARHRADPAVTACISAGAFAGIGISPDAVTPGVLLGWLMPPGPPAGDLIAREPGIPGRTASEQPKPKRETKLMRCRRD